MSKLSQLLREMDRASFEDLCFQVLSEKYKGTTVRKLNGAGGDGGVDIFRGKLSERPEVWQCKHFPNGVKRPQRRQIEKSLTRALDKFRPRRWALCIPVDLDINAMKWFESLQQKYAGIAKIDLIQGSQIERELVWRPRIVRAFFPGATLQEETIKALIAKEDSLTREQLETRSEELVSRWKQCLEEKDPTLTIRVTYPHESTFPDVREGARSLIAEDGLIASFVDESKRLDVFAKDQLALLESPLQGHFTLREAAVKKLEKAMLTGEPADFCSDEIVEFKSPLEHLGMGESHPGRLILFPRPEAVGKRVHLRVTFVGSDENVIYEHLEFETTRAGTAEAEIATVSPLLPFKFSITIIPPSAGGFAFSPKWWGKDARAVKKACSLASMLSKGCEVYAYDLEAERELLHGRVDPEREPEIAKFTRFKEFVEKLACISERFSVALTVEIPTRDDLDNINTLYELVRKGKASIVSGEGTLRFLLVKDDRLVPNIVGLEDPRSLRNFAIVFRENAVVLPVFGQKIGIGPGTLYCPKAVLSNLDEFRESYASATPGQAVEVRVRALDGIEIYLSKSPSSAGAS